ncbi:unnamed protein product [Pylaiella littoralis]
MIDQDYAELLGRSPPTGDLLEWTFPARSLSNAFVSLLIGTPALCLAMFVLGGEADDVPGSIDFRVPTLTQLGLRTSPVGDVFTAGMHLAAVMAIPLFWCVKLSHHQRLQARTGVARYDLQAEDAIRWVTAAWIVGTLGAGLMFAAASVPGDVRGVWSSAQGVAHLVLSLLAACGMIGQAVCTAWALTKARRVFVVSEADLVAYRQKICLASLAVVAVFAAVSSVLLVECFADGGCGVGVSNIISGSRSGSSSNSMNSASDVFGGGGAGRGGGSTTVDVHSGFFASDMTDAGTVTFDIGTGTVAGSSGSSSRGTATSVLAAPTPVSQGGSSQVEETTSAAETAGAGAVEAEAEEAVVMGAEGGGSRVLPGEKDSSNTNLSSSSRRSSSRKRDCDTEWCYSRSLLGVWEWFLLMVQAGFCIALRHDLAPATGGVGVESFVL